MGVRRPQTRVCRNDFFLVIASTFSVTVVVLSFLLYPLERIPPSSFLLELPPLDHASSAVDNTNHKQAGIILERDTAVAACGIGTIRSNTINSVVSTDSIIRRRRLELIHIPKTGGSTLSAVAAQHNVSWGACHWSKSVSNQPCPPHPPAHRHHPGLERLFHTTIPSWHVPISCLHLNITEKDRFLNPYHNANLVAVVRHPFARLVSHFNYMRHYHRRFRKQQQQQDTNTILQQWLTWLLTATPDTSSYYTEGAHLIPQSHFLLLNNNNCRNCTHIHILRQEHLQHDFHCLMKLYRLDWKLPNERINESAVKRKKRSMTVQDLTEETKQLARRVYAQDFKLFGYSPF